jgi:hypothetical protein
MMSAAWERAGGGGSQQDEITFNQSSRKRPADFFIVAKHFLVYNI